MPRVTALSTISWATRWLGVGRARNVPAAEVADFKIRTGMTSGNTVFEDLELVTTAGKEIVIATDIRDAQEARWLTEEMKRAVSGRRF